ncbi:hypothetical protein TIFTF001_027572 [Ficus carica]|uniref:Uncharacterized protein n=1 Tax=Ficus carica TaxID=3494 RepID=A0AA88IVB9_FICCA|nr:hypothetical protein TIFTF001_027572 [Ficus carica]
MRAGLVHGLSWIGLAAPTTPWLCTTVNNLPEMLDARLWRMAPQIVKFGLDTTTCQEGDLPKHVDRVKQLASLTGQCVGNALRVKDF